MGLLSRAVKEYPGFIYGLGIRNVTLNHTNCPYKNSRETPLLSGIGLFGHVHVDSSARTPQTPHITEGLQTKC